MAIKFSSNLNMRKMMNIILSATAQNMGMKLTSDSYKGFWAFCDQITPAPQTNDQIERQAEFYLNG